MIFLLAFPDYLGIAAGACTAASMLPQLVKIIKEKKAEAISIPMLLTLLGGLVLWIIYGVLKTDWPIIVTNCFSFLVNTLIIFFSMKYKKENN